VAAGLVAEGIYFLSAKGVTTVGMALTSVLVNRRMTAALPTGE
jgi:hypothetical protein